MTRIIALAVLTLLPSCKRPAWECTPFGAGRRCVELASPPLPESFACYEASGREVCTHDSAPRLPLGFTCRRAGADTVCYRAVNSHPDASGARAWRCLRERSGRRACVSRDLGNDPWDCDASSTCRRYFPDYPDDGEWECYDSGGRQICRSQERHLSSPEWTCREHDRYRICVDPDPDAPGPGYRCQFEADAHARRCRPDPKPPVCGTDADCGRGICEAGACLRPLLAECFWDSDCGSTRCGGGTCGRR
jgi:hypothetical protein